MEYEEFPIDLLYKEIKNKAQTQKHIIIIIPDESQLMIPNGVYQDSFPITVGHADRIELFSNFYNIEIVIETGMLGHEVSIQLANLGHFAITIEEDNLVCYIPNSVSPNQKKWFDDNQILLNEFKVSGFYFEGRVLNHLSYKKDNPSEVLQKLTEKIDEKIVVQNQEPKMR